MTILFWTLGTILAIVLIRVSVHYYVKQELYDMTNSRIVNPVEIDLNKHYLLLMDRLPLKELDTVKKDLADSGYRNIIPISGAIGIERDI